MKNVDLGGVRLHSELSVELGVPGIAIALVSLVDLPLVCKTAGCQLIVALSNCGLQSQDGTRCGKQQ